MQNNTEGTHNVQNIDGCCTCGPLMGVPQWLVTLDVGCKSKAIWPANASGRCLSSLRVPTSSLYRRPSQGRERVP